MSNRVYATMVLALSHLTLLAQGPQAVIEQYLEHISKKSYAEATKLQTVNATARIALSASEMGKSEGLGNEAAVHLLMDENAKGFQEVVDILEMEEEAMIRVKYETGISQAFYLIRKEEKWYVAAPKEVEKTGRYYITCIEGEKEVILTESELSTDQTFRGENLNIGYTLSVKEVDMLKKDSYAYIMMAGKLMTLTIGEVSDKTGQSIEAEKIEGRIKRAELIQRSSYSTLYRFDGTFHGERFDNGKFSVAYEIIN